MLDLHEESEVDESILQEGPLEEIPVDDVPDPGLRPQTLEDFIGQSSLKESLRVFVQAAKNREEPLDHALFYGNPGLGKTTLAHILANEMEAQIRVTSGPALERVGDLAAILSNLKAGDILFIDEIHRLNRAIEEVLYPAMEDRALDLVVGKGPTARTLRLSLEPFTIIGATTRLSLLSAPLRDRFGLIQNLPFYEVEEIRDIVLRSATLLDFDLTQEGAEVIAQRSRNTPRVANRLLKRVRDYAEVEHHGDTSPEVVHAALDMLSIDTLGLTQTDRAILSYMIEMHGGGPVGITSIASSLQQEEATLESVHEPFLLQIGFVTRTPRGRTVTSRAYEHLGYDIDNL
jgi:Holliday junction DNA helicase RuvB